jgi:hypothetical protein
VWGREAISATYLGWEHCAYESVVFGWLVGPQVPGTTRTDPLGQ